MKPHDWDPEIDYAKGAVVFNKQQWWVATEQSTRCEPGTSQYGWAKYPPTVPWNAFDIYQDAAARTLRERDDFRDTFANLALGLAGEAGEVADMIKKQIFHGHGQMGDPNFRAKIVEELGDALWYLSALCSAAKLNLADIAACNIDKLRKRYPEGFSEERSRNRTENINQMEHNNG